MRGKNKETSHQTWLQWFIKGHKSVLVAPLWKIPLGLAYLYFMSLLTWLVGVHTHGWVFDALLYFLAIVGFISSMMVLVLTTGIGEMLIGLCWVVYMPLWVLDYGGDETVRLANGHIGQRIEYKDLDKEKGASTFRISACRLAIEKKSIFAARHVFWVCPLVSQTWDGKEPIKAWFVCHDGSCRNIIESVDYQEFRGVKWTAEPTLKGIYKAIQVTAQEHKLKTDETPLLLFRIPDGEEYVKGEKNMVSSYCLYLTPIWLLTVLLFRLGYATHYWRKHRGPRTHLFTDHEK